MSVVLDHAAEATRIATDYADSPASRIARLRRLADDVRFGLKGQPGGSSEYDDFNAVTGQIARYIGELELEREGSLIASALLRLEAAEDADIRDDLEGAVSHEALEAVPSHDELAALEADGLLAEAVLKPKGRGGFGLALNFDERKVRRGRGGKFADKPGLPDAPAQGGTPNTPGGTSAEATARAKAAAKPGVPQPAAPQPPAQQAPAPSPSPAQQAEEVKQRIGTMATIRERLAEVMKYGLDDWPTKGEVAQRILGDAHDTQELHTRPLPASPGSEGEPTKRGYTAERRRVHDAIIGRALAGPLTDVLGADHALVRKLDRGGRLTEDERGQVREVLAARRNGAPPRALFMAGGPASGKTSALDASPELQPDAAVTINPDDMKEALPEYHEMVDGGEKYAANGVHEESSDLGKRLQMEAMDLGMNVVVDGTGDSKKGKFVGKMRDMDEAGYDVSALYVTIPTDEAVIRATLRAMKSGRWVPTPELRSQHKNVSANFEDVAAFDGVTSLKLFDNMGDGGPRLIAEGVRGQLSVHDDDLFRQFIAKKEEGDG